MSNRIVATSRPWSGWVPVRLSKNKAVKQVHTRENIDDELWCYLEYFSEIEDVGIKYIKAKGIKKYPTYKKVFYMFQGFVRQAKNYYNAAKLLHYRSSSLLYYYCFLNLVKAYLLLNMPQKIINKKIKHGLFLPKENLKFSKQSVRVNNGIFPIFHQSETGSTLRNNTNLNIINLLSFCREISLQYEGGDFGKCKIIPCFFSIVLNEVSKEAWSITAIQSFDEISRYRNIVKSFNEYFEEIELPKDSSREMFQIQGWAHQDYSYFQSKNPRSLISDKYIPLDELNEELKLALKEVFYGNYYPDNHAFVISLPYLLNKQFQMIEPLAIYAIMFYLGSLVRYKPEYLEKLLASEPAWLIESFVRTCPLTFLQVIISRILGIDYIIKKD